MEGSEAPVVVGLDNGGNTNNATVLASDGRFLVDRMMETPSRVQEGPAAAVGALAEAMRTALAATGVPLDRVAAVGLDEVVAAHRPGLHRLRHLPERC